MADPEHLELSVDHWIQWREVKPGPPAAFLKKSGKLAFLLPRRPRPMETILSQPLTLEEQCEQAKLDDFQLESDPPSNSFGRMRYASVMVLAIGLTLWASNLESPDIQQVKNPPPTPQIEQAPVHATETVQEEIDYEEWINRVPLHKPKKWQPFGKLGDERVEVVG